MTSPKSKAAKGGEGPVLHVQASGTDRVSAAQIEAAGPLTIVLLTGARNPEVHTGAILPAGAAIGDAVEVYVRGYSGRIYAPDGEGFDVDHALDAVPVASGVLFRKTSERGWRFIGH